MTARRMILIGVIVTATLAAVLALASPFPWLPTYYLVFEDFYPERISWDGKTAWKRCDSAIAGRTSWPIAAPDACAAMHLCANEAPLVEAQKRLLKQAIRRTPGCQEL
jgi:hypothetical protein